MPKITITQTGNLADFRTVLSDADITDDIRIDEEGFSLYIGDYRSSFLFHDVGCIKTNGAKKVYVTYTGTEYELTKQTCIKLKSACEKSGRFSEVTYEDRTPFWFKFLRNPSGQGVTAELVHVAESFPIRGETNFITFGDTTDRRKTRMTVCLDNVEPGQTFEFKYCKTDVFDFNEDQRGLMGLIQSLDTIEKPDGITCAARGNRYRYKGSNRLLTAKKVLAYKYIFKNTWSSTQLPCFPITEVVIKE